jgi:hypothetical protein
LSTDLINPDEEEELNSGQNLVNSHFPVIAGGKRPHPLTTTHRNQKNALYAGQMNGIQSALEPNKRILIPTTPTTVGFD